MARIVPVLLLACLPACRGQQPGPFELPEPAPAGAAPAPRLDRPQVVVRRKSYPGTDRPRSLRELLILPGGGLVQHGREAAWYPDGHLEYERFFDHDRPTGVWRAWYRDGSPRSEVHCDPETLGISRWWYENGQLSSEGPAIGGAKQGHWVHYHPNGTKSSEGDYARSRKDGEWSTWDEEGRLVEHGWYDHGVRVGTWEILGEDGALVTRTSEDEE